MFGCCYIVSPLFGRRLGEYTSPSNPKCEWHRWTKSDKCSSFGRCLSSKRRGLASLVQNASSMKGLALVDAYPIKGGVVSCESGGVFGENEVGVIVLVMVMATVLEGAMSASGRGTIRMDYGLGDGVEDVMEVVNNGMVEVNVEA
ncbi:hypothetical protein VNO78_11101 [Psophocarpus tetragonolobus]|uniref:Uncharacterized protein n=1 Tax=Psophocarpus tetragonolobus TaxID=3891 RepID=A0AAN9SNL3_PSOTE